MARNTSLSVYQFVGFQGRGGYTMLFAILVMGIMSVATVSLASIVLQSLRTARQLDDATVAFYAAEAGNEEALYQVGQGTACPALNTTSEVALSNGATFKRVCATDGTQILIRSTGSFGAAKMALHCVDHVRPTFRSEQRGGQIIQLLDAPFADDPVGHHGAGRDP